MRTKIATTALLASLAVAGVVLAPSVSAAPWPRSTPRCRRHPLQHRDST